MMSNTPSGRDAPMAVPPSFLAAVEGRAPDETRHSDEHTFISTVRYLLRRAPASAAALADAEAAAADGDAYLRAIEATAPRLGLLRGALSKASERH
jgi:hypothetical protein